MTALDARPGPAGTTPPALPVGDRPPALLARPVMDRGSALWRFHTALDDLVLLTAVPAAAAVPEPADVADVLAALAAGLGQLDPVLGQLADRLTALADSPNAGTAPTTQPAGAQLVDGQLPDGQLGTEDVTGVLGTALGALAAARSGLAGTAVATVAAAGHARRLVLADPDQQPGPAGPGPA